MPAAPLKIPYETPDEFRDAIIAAGGVKLLAVDLGVAENTVRAWVRRMGMDPGDIFRARLAKEKGERPPRVVSAPPEEGGFEWLLDAIREAGGDASVEEIANLADVSPRRVREAIPRAREAGYRLPEMGEGRVVLDRVSPVPTDEMHSDSLRLFDGDRIRFGIISDTHLGSAECHLADLHAAYDLMVEEGVETIYHPGDLCAGIGVYRHQHRDLAPHAHTFDEQVEYAAREYPKRDGVQTFIISGNHDVEGEFGRLGADACLAVANQRDDMTHCGVYSAWFEVQNGARIHVLHPMGGASYATSYRLQKMAESYSAGEKPNILIAGHWHRSGFFWARGIALMHAGTFEGSTNLAVRLGLGEPHLGCWIVDATVADDGTLTRITPQWVPFWNGRRVG